MTEVLKELIALRKDNIAGWKRTDPLDRGKIIQLVNEVYVEDRLDRPPNILFLTNLNGIKKAMGVGSPRNHVRVGMRSNSAWVNYRDGATDAELHAVDAVLHDCHIETWTRVRAALGLCVGLHTNHRITVSINKIFKTHDESTSPISEQLVALNKEAWGYRLTPEYAFIVERPMKINENSVTLRSGEVVLL